MLVCVFTRLKAIFYQIEQQVTFKLSDSVPNKPSGFVKWTAADTDTRVAAFVLRQRGGGGKKRKKEKKRKKHY